MAVEDSVLTVDNFVENFELFSIILSTIDYRRNNFYSPKYVYNEMEVENNEEQALYTLLITL